MLAFTQVSRSARYQSADNNLADEDVAKNVGWSCKGRIFVIGEKCKIK
jgi:hypothetical protein